MAKKKSDYTLLQKMTPEERIAHCENMAEFWEKVCPSTASQYANRAKKLRAELEVVA